MDFREGGILAFFISGGINLLERFKHYSLRPRVNETRRYPLIGELAAVSSAC